MARLGKAAAFVAAVLTAVLAVSWTASAKPAVTGVRAYDHGSKTRFVLDLNESVPFRVFTLADPYRIVVDLPELDWTAAQAGLRKAIGPIRDFRYGLFKPGNARLVLDLADATSVKKAFVLPPGEGAGWRFVLDLVGTSRDAFLREQGLPPDLVPQPKPVPTAAIPVSMTLPDRNPRAIRGKAVIVIDPGHGGVDPGAIGVSGEYEKNITLAMARELKQALDASGRYKVALTRNSDVFLALRDRVAKARAVGADLFVSLHADTVRSPSVRGLSVYTLSERASDAESAALAEKENKADLIAGLDLSHESPEVTNILIDLAQRESMNLSAAFAGDLVQELGRETALLGNTHRFAGFAVLKAPDIPSVLVELGYLSNPQEERLLRRRDHRAKLASALARSIDRYFANIQRASRP